MPKRIIKAVVGRLKPWKPTRSLPSYKEPTPETNRRLTREDEAELALTRTVFTPGTAQLLVALFLLTIVSVPITQLVAEIRAPRAGGGLAMFDVFRALPSAEKVKAVRTLRDVWNLLPHAEDLKKAEEALESDSVVSQWLLPPVQALLIGKLRAANEQVYLGRDGWLFYRPDVDYVTGPAFLEPSRLRQRAHAAALQPDPIKAIVQFRDQLASRGIELVLLPVPTKASIEGERLSSRVEPGTLLENATMAEFQRRLAAAGLRVFDPAPLLMQRKMAANGAPQYLETDTHWRPETMEFVAQQLAASLNLPAVEAPHAPQFSPKQITGEGDIARMLKLPKGEAIDAPQTVTINQVTAADNFWRPSRDADLLLLGDSFANIFSLEALGWGESAGLAEHLSAALGGRPVDTILRNSDAAFASREMLANELARGRDRLAGKKVVIWEFAARELAFGNWKLLEMKLGAPAASRFFTPSPGGEIKVTGTVEAVGSVPRPGSVPYADHITAVHLTDVSLADRPGAEPLQAIVYLWSMRDNVWADAARLRPGERVTLRLKPWGDVAAQLEQINRSEIDDPELQLEEPAWGELVQ
jgi:alginate O-acetyltransferase complex protein AlgJ